MKYATILGLVLIINSGIPVEASDPPSESHKAAAAELLTIMDIERTMMGGAAAMTEAMIQQNPQLRPFQDIILKWAESFMTWETFGPRFVEIYIESFTEPELRDMIAFYKTPTGRKALHLMPELMQRGAVIGAEVANEHSQELEQMVRERAAELEQQPTKP